MRRPSAPSPREPASAAPLALRPSVDPGRVEILRELGNRVGQDVLAELIWRYVEEAPERLRAVAAAAERGDRAQARSLAHGLKGVSSNLGATAIASLLEGLERSLGGVSDVAPLLVGLAAELARTVEELRRLAAGAAG